MDGDTENDNLLEGRYETGGIFFVEKNIWKNQGMGNLEKCEKNQPDRV